MTDDHSQSERNDSTLNDGELAGVSGGWEKRHLLPYIVKKGDNLTRIATIFGVRIDEILRANPEIVPTMHDLKIGYILMIPVMGTRRDQPS